MKIGWLRLTMSIEIDYNTAKVGYCEMRVGWMKALVNCGHTIKILTGMSKESEYAYEHVNEEGFSTGPYSLDWAKDKLEYAPTGDASDCELLIVENSAVNFMYGDKYTNQPCIRRAAQLLDSYKGIVVIEQSDPDLPFPFWKMACAEFDWNDPNNPYRISVEEEAKIDNPDMERYGWATRDEIFKDKKYVVIVKSPHKKKTLKIMNGTRYRYADLEASGDISVHYIGQAYDPALGNIEDEKQPEYDLIYAGYPRGREKHFKKHVFENSCSWDKMCVIGPWHKKKNQELAEELPYEHVDNLGYVRWSEVPKCVHNSICSLYLGVSRSIRLDWETSRPFEAIMNGSILIYGNESKWLNEMFGDTFNTEKKRHLVASISAMSPEDRKALWKFQYDKIAHRNWYWFLGQLHYLLRLVSKKCKLIDKKTLEAMVPNEMAGVELPVVTWPNVDELSASEEVKALREELRNKFDKEIRSKFNEPDCYNTYEEIEACFNCPWVESCIVATKEKSQQEDQPVVEKIETVEEVKQVVETSTDVVEIIIRGKRVVVDFVQKSVKILDSSTQL